MLKRIIYILSMLIIICLCGCGENVEHQVGEIIEEKRELLTAVFDESVFQEDDKVKLDLSSASYGYIAISAYSDKRLKLQVIKDDNTYTYDIDSNGAPSILPLQCGNGLYSFRVLENVSENSYADVYFAEKEATLIDEFQPYLRPNDYVNYTEKSDCIQKANELAQGNKGDLDIVKNVFNFIFENITYDYEKAKTVKSGYLPDPDSTLREKKGICFDYASLTAAMLRSQGIPTKVIFGYVSPDNAYHAWNMFYTKETGWVTAEYKVKDNKWNRLDLTFSTIGATDDFVLNDKNYMDVYFY